MMDERTNVTCGVIRDLLPLYVEGIAGKDSAALVEAHLAGCPACRAAREQLTAPAPAIATRRTEAESFARAAIKIDPDLYVAWETLGSALLDQNKNLDEAESCINKAISLSKGKNGQVEDVRMYLALARVQIAKGDDRSRSQARVTLRKVRDRKNELPEHDLEEFERLQKAVQVKR